MIPIYQGDSKAAIIEVLIEGVDDISAWASKALLVPGSPLKREVAAALVKNCSSVDATHVKMELASTDTETLSPGSYTLLLRVSNVTLAKRLSVEVGVLIVNPDPEA